MLSEYPSLWFASAMYLSGIHNNQPLVHGVIGHRDRVVVHDAGLNLSTTAPVAGGPMLIDTGAQVSVLDLDLALDLGLPETDTPSQVRGVAGAIQARQFTGLLHLPEWNITMPTTFVSLPLQEHHSLLAIIGMDVLVELILTIDGPARRITLTAPR